MDKTKGLFNKYRITKTSGKPVDPNARYFVLRLDEGQEDKKFLHACQKALRAFCKEIHDHNPQLAVDLDERFLPSINKTAQPQPENKSKEALLYEFRSEYNGEMVIWPSDALEAMQEYADEEAGKSRKELKAQKKVSFKFYKNNEALQAEIQAVKLSNGKLVETLELINEANEYDDNPSNYIRSLITEAISSLNDKTQDI